MAIPIAEVQVLVQESQREDLSPEECIAVGNKLMAIGKMLTEAGEKIIQKAGKEVNNKESKLGQQINLLSNELLRTSGNSKQRIALATKIAELCAQYASEASPDAEPLPEAATAPPTAPSFDPHPLLGSNWTRHEDTRPGHHPEFWKDEKGNIVIPRDYQLGQGRAAAGSLQAFLHSCNIECELI